MSKVLVQGNVVETARAVFSGEDQKALNIYSSFEGFQIQNIMISQLFSEFSDSIETFHLPEKVGEELFWPEGETFCENLNKRKIYIYPHCYVPKLLFLLQPVAALRAATFYIFKLIFGVDNEHQGKCGLAKINIKLL